MFRISYNAKDLKALQKDEDFASAFKAYKKYGLVTTDGDASVWLVNGFDGSQHMQTLISLMKDIAKIEEIDTVHENTAIEAVCLPPPIQNKLKKKGISTIKDLMDTPPEELLSIYGLNKKRTIPLIDLHLSKIGYPYKEKWYSYKPKKSEPVR